MTIQITQAQTVEKEAVIVKVKSPLQLTNVMITAGFQKAIPVYQAIDGLEFKAFSLTKIDENTYFGGIYLWENKEKADKWFTPEWTEKAKKTYGSEPLVARLAVIKDTNFIKKDFDYKTDKTVSVFVNGLSEKDAKKQAKKSNGLLRSYFVKTANGYGVILLFINAATADNFVKKIKIQNYELFQTPVLLNNVK